MFFLENPMEANVDLGAKSFAEGLGAFHDVPTSKLL